VEGVKRVFEPLYMVGKMTLLFYFFTERLVGLLFKSVDFINLCCITCQRRELKMGKSTLVLDSSKSISIKAILISL